MRTLTGLLVLCTALFVGCSPAVMQITEVAVASDTAVNQDQVTSAQQEPATEEVLATAGIQDIIFESSWIVSAAESNHNSLALISTSEPSVTARITQREIGCGWEASWHVTYERDGRQCVDSAVWSVGRHAEAMPDIAFIVQENDTEARTLYGISVGWEEHVARDLWEAMNPDTRAGVCF